MKLSDKIWITRKTRINTEKRLKRYALISEVIMIIFSLVMVYLSIWNFVDQNIDINFLLICGSIGVLIASIYLSSQRFSERALQIRNCYIRLDELNFKVKSIEELGNKDSLKEAMTEYKETLLNIENHNDYDYLCLRYSLRNDKEATFPEFSRIDLFHYFIEKFLRIFLVFLIFLSPFILLILYSYFK
ncbi:MAG: SLATT domain-containing protein [Bacteroidales bacterium]|jgi:ABC-type bacteriocin/lantibiotic exporter with double-glycine peptidase domain|nr:SLATT domain-containing protein [Bacteroidales bacterium]